MATITSFKTVSEIVDANPSNGSYINQAFERDIPRGLNNNEKEAQKNGSISTKIPVKSYLDIPACTKTKGNIIKNLVAISIGFLFLFTAFSALANIQSSLNSDEGLGTASLSVIYGALVLSCMFVPSFIIKFLGCKWTLVAAVLMYSTYMGANFDPSWASLIPTSIIVGIAAAPLWSAKCTYLTQIGGEYAELSGEEAEPVIVRFFGFFFMVFQSGQITGNLISSLVLKPGDNDNSTISPEQLDICGFKYCNEPFPYGNFSTASESNATDTAEGSKEKLYVLCGIYLGCAFVAAVIIAVIVDPLIRRIDPKKPPTPALHLLVATFKHMKNPKQLLLIPLTIYSGIEQAFMTGDFTKSLVTCSLGIHMVGYVMVCYGTVDAICSFAFSPVVKKVGRIPVYIFGALINVAVAITIFSWRPNPDNLAIYFVLSGLWGMADAIWQTQINAFYGVIFPNNTEAAFSNYRLWESIGFIIAFAYSSELCIYEKLYSLLGILAAGMTGYFIIEYNFWKLRKNNENEKK